MSDSFKNEFCFSSSFQSAVENGGSDDNSGARGMIQ